MAISVRVPDGFASLARGQYEVEPAPLTIGALVTELERRHPGAGSVLNSSAVNAVLNGEVILHGRDVTPIDDGDEVEFLIMFAGG